MFTFYIILFLIYLTQNETNICKFSSVVEEILLIAFFVIAITNFTSQVMVNSFRMKLDNRELKRLAYGTTKFLRSFEILVHELYG